MRFVRWRVEELGMPTAVEYAEIQRHRDAWYFLVKLRSRGLQAMLREDRAAVDALVVEYRVGIFKADLIRGI